MSKQVPVVLEGELVVPFSQLYPIYTYWADYLQLAQDQPNAIQEV